MIPQPRYWSKAMLTNAAPMNTIAPSANGAPWPHARLSWPMASRPTASPRGVTAGTVRRTPATTKRRGRRTAATNSCCCTRNNVTRTFLSAGSGDFQSPEQEHGTGKSREPAGWKACATRKPALARTAPKLHFWAVELTRQMPEADRLKSGLHSRGVLPHLKSEGASYFVTFRLAGTLPRDV